MQLIGLTQLVREFSAYQDLLSRLQSATPTAGDAHIVRSARAYFLAALAQDWRGPLLYLTARGKRAHNIAEQLPVWLGDVSRIYRYAEPTPMFYDRLPWERASIQARIETLYALQSKQPDTPQPLIISSARALMQRTLPPDTFQAHLSTLSVGECHDPLKLSQAWLAMGYEPVTMVIEPGTFSRRGGILDIYPLAAKLPTRIDFFDDEIETLRSFDPSSQRTAHKIESVTIPPAREALPATMPQAADALANWFNGLASGNGTVISATQDADALREGQAFQHLEHYLPYAINETVTLLDYLPENALVIVEDADDLRETVLNLMQEAEHNRENNIRTKQISPNHPAPYADWQTLEQELSTRPALRITSTGTANDTDADSSTNGTGAAHNKLFAPGERFGGQLKTALNRLRERRKAGERIVIVTQQIERLAELWYEQDASAAIPKLQDIHDLSDAAGLVFVPGVLSEGWTLSDGCGDALTLVTDAELFNWSRPEPRRRKATSKRANKLPESDYTDWKAGDYVVHVDYGIGQFQGLRARTVEGNEREYLVVEYADRGMLFVPIHQADRLTRYVGPDESPPSLSKLDKPAEWTKARQKARKAAEDEAKELLQIYARRAKTHGHTFNDDTPWQRELEASFPYVETEDQLNVLKEIKRDMQSSMPMDRLVCGDVGFGKTEVALRAAFKAVMDGKQVAVLVPTTVLASQHYETFSRRMEPFPIKVEMLSRFRGKAEQNKIVDELSRGQVDIIIGTHRLLSKDIRLQDLGLIIVDEEQRFGVKHKEHFKSLRAQVDILTLTATPIPRTLYMSLTGVRDISMIQTPPEERLPVITHVGPLDEKLIRQAVLREMDRGGQVFVIHNRVKSIYQLQDRIEQIVPEASTVVGHGKMTGKQLEAVISDFGKGAYDILLATSIIENGIDMPNVNTLIVDRADWFGMSQLYQIRGRVGRSAQQAYAYFFHPGGKLTEEAKVRLETLAEHTELGAGFQIAMRDMELRGAGDILSMKQTGHVATVGLHLYTQLLQQAIRDQKGEPQTASVPTYEQERLVIDLPLAAYIPNDWIPEMALRLQLYRRIGSLQNTDDIATLRDELQDRFGVLPEAVEGLLYQIEVKLLATAVNAVSVIKPRQHILVKLPWLAAVDRKVMQWRLNGSDNDDVEVSRTAVELRMDADNLWRLRLLDVLNQIKDGMPQQVGV